MQSLISKTVHNRRMLRRHPLLALFTIGYLAVVAWVTLGPQPLDAAGGRALFRILAIFGRHEITQWITYDRVQFIANIAMFVPIGLLFLLVLGRRRWWLAIAGGVLLTVIIEAAQRGIPGRVSDVNDIIGNSLGAIIGVIVALIVTTPAAIRDRRDARLAEEARADLRARAAAGRPSGDLTLHR